MKTFNFLIYLIFFFCLASQNSFSQCPNGLVASITLSGPSTCQCITAQPLGGVPPYSYLWSNGDIGGTICPGFSGTFMLTVVDAAGCTDDTSVSITWNLFDLNVVTTNALCRNGTATAQINGGVPPFTYSWSTVPVQTDSIATGLIAFQTYYVTVTDDSGCVLTGAASIPSTSNINS